MRSMPETFLSSDSTGRVGSFVRTLHLSRASCTFPKAISRQAEIVQNVGIVTPLAGRFLEKTVSPAEIATFIGDLCQNRPATWGHSARVHLLF